MDHNDVLSGREAAVPVQACQKHLASLADAAGCQYQIEEAIMRVARWQKEKLQSGSVLDKFLTIESCRHLYFEFQLVDAPVDFEQGCFFFIAYNLNV